METSVQKVRPARLRRRTRYLLMGGAAMAAIGAASLLPGEAKKMLHTSGYLHSGVHVLAFTLLGFLSFRGVRSTGARVLILCAGGLLATATEFGEHQIYGSPLEYRDIAADGVGLAIGWISASLARKRRVRLAMQSS